MEALRSNGVKVDTNRGKGKMQEELQTFGGTLMIIGCSCLSLLSTFGVKEKQQRQ